jgi:hypothetical protein
VNTPISTWRVYINPRTACSQAPQVSLTFGGQTYAIDPADFARDVGEDTCVGGALVSESLGMQLA